MRDGKYSYNDNINRYQSESAGRQTAERAGTENTEKGMGVKMFGKKKEQTIETNGVVYRREKTWRIALSCCSSGIGMSFYVLLGLASYVVRVRDMELQQQLSD